MPIPASFLGVGGDREQHAVAVDSHGVAFSWGSGGTRWDGAGALGLGDLEGVNYIVPTPTEITTMSGVGAKVSVYVRA